jgi:hypothetical protein
MTKQLTSRGVNYGTLPVNNGGTGLTSVGTTGNVLTSNGTTWVSQAAPISLPSQTGNATKYLTTDGTSASWNSIPKTVSVLTRNGSSVSTVSVSVNYVAVLSRSNISIQVSIT